MQNEPSEMMDSQYHSHNKAVLPACLLDIGMSLQWAEELKAVATPICESGTSEVERFYRPMSHRIGVACNVALLKPKSPHCHPIYFLTFSSI